MPWKSNVSVSPSALRLLSSFTFLAWDDVNDLNWPWSSRNSILNSGNRTCPGIKRSWSRPKVDRNDSMVPCFASITSLYPALITIIDGLDAGTVCAIPGLGIARNTSTRNKVMMVASRKARVRTGDLRKGIAAPRSCKPCSIQASRQFSTGSFVIMNRKRRQPAHLISQG